MQVDLIQDKLKNEGKKSDSDVDLWYGKKKKNYINNVLNYYV